jgi:hypothetical protein
MTPGTFRRPVDGGRPAEPPPHRAQRPIAGPHVIVRPALAPRVSLTPWLFGPGWGGTCGQPALWRRPCCWAPHCRRPARRPSRASIPRLSQRTRALPPAGQARSPAGPQAQPTGPARRSTREPARAGPRAQPPEEPWRRAPAAGHRPGRVGARAGRCARTRARGEPRARAQASPAQPDPAGPLATQPSEQRRPSERPPPGAAPPRAGPPRAGRADASHGSVTAAPKAVAPPPPRVFQTGPPPGPRTATRRCALRRARSPSSR